jgi:hypothetical protein
LERPKYSRKNIFPISPLRFERTIKSAALLAGAFIIVPASAFAIS